MILISYTVGIGSGADIRDAIEVLEPEVDVPKVDVPKVGAKAVAESEAHSVPGSDSFSESLRIDDSPSIVLSSSRSISSLFETEPVEKKDRMSLTRFIML